MKNLIKIIVTISFLFSTNGFAQSASSFFEIKEPPRAAEYIYRSSPKESLIGVQLLGAVKNPGIYYIPTNTDVLKLLALAGGSEDADLSEILVRKNRSDSSWCV
jgi:competence protein ComEA